MNVMSLRLSAAEKGRILRWAKQAKKDQSEAARELLELGWKFALLELYRSGKISLGRLSKEYRLSISETMDFLADHGVSAKLDAEVYLESLENLRKAI